MNSDRPSWYGISRSGVRKNLSSLSLVCGWCGLDVVSPIPLSSRSASNAVGFHLFPGASFLPPLPTKHEPLSDRIFAGVPNAAIARRRG